MTVAANARWFQRHCAHAGIPAMPIFKEHATPILERRRPNRVHVWPPPTCQSAKGAHCMDGHESRDKAGCRADTERPARARMVSNPADNRRANRGAPEGDTDT